MIPELTNPEIQEFIQEHLYDDPATLMLQASRFPDLPMAAIVEQIQSKRKAKTKLPGWFDTPGVIYPPRLSMEQCSSETTASYKASLLQGDSLLDMTGGFGVDASLFSKRFNSITYLERRKELVYLALHNFKKLGANNIELRQADSINYLEKCAPFSAIYVDPARRGNHNQKVFRFEDCEPNLVQHINLLKSKAKTIMIKASPMLEIKQGIKDLGGVSAVHVVAVQNEVKELLFIIEGKPKSNPPVYCVNLKTGDDTPFELNYQDEEAALLSYAEVGEYIYEPNAAIMKAGGFNSIALRQPVSKLHPNTHLYTSNQLVNGFPGRTFKVMQRLTMNKKELKKLLPNGKANITTRNFPMTVVQIRKKTGLKEGGENYLIGLTDQEGPRLLYCEKA